MDTDVELVVNAEAAVASAQRDYASNVAKLRQAEANNHKAQSDLVRYKKRADQGEISLSDYDQYVAKAGADQAAVEASQYADASSQQSVEECKAQRLEQQGKYSEDNANLLVRLPFARQRLIPATPTRIRRRRSSIWPNST